MPSPTATLSLRSTLSPRGGRFIRHDAPMPSRKRRHAPAPPPDPATLRRVYWRSCLGYLALHISAWFLLVVLATTVLQPTLSALPAPGGQHGLDTWFLRTGAFLTFGIMVAAYAARIVRIERSLGIRR